jgi:outer membrane receptor for ferrienterochelin and colicins
MRILVALVFTALSSFLLKAQTGEIEGYIQHKSQALGFANVSIKALGLGTATDEKGRFFFDQLVEGKYQLEVSRLGYSPKSIEVEVKEGQVTSLTVELKPDLINLDGVVVSGTRSEVPVFEAPVIVSQINNKTFENTQALTLSEGLAFSPGLRLENNCVNCGFTQLRMNGLDGAYSQVLINSRPIFSPLMGVYGLDLIPANMIDRVEVVRGGGSALYGGNAIAGTVNIITRDPLDNSIELGVNQALINGEASDQALSLNGSVVSKDLKKGLNFYGFNRNRDYWDANGDGFSELTLLENNTFGFDAYWRPTDRSRLELNGFLINEFRRGGNDFDLQPHQTDITEQLDHSILGASLSYEQFSANYQHKVSIYTSFQTTQRDSYYGGGGRVLAPGDSLTDEDVLALNAYGYSTDFAITGGVQYNYNPSEFLGITVGSELQANSVEDEMPGYSRFILQDVTTLGTYAQVEYKPVSRLTVLAGGRFDAVRIDGTYDFQQELLLNQRDLGVFVPRASLMFDASQNLKLRASYAQGYRAPQAFDEDLHIETVGGAAVFIQLDPNLVTETSDSYSASLNYSKTTEFTQINLVAEGFMTLLDNPFITANQEELPNGIAVLTKRNGDGAVVQGINLEANAAFNQEWILSAGFTIQSANYNTEEEIWAPQTLTDSNADSVITTSRMVRTPDHYGYFSLSYTPGLWIFNASGVYTGSMDIPHVIDPETEFTILERTPGFMEWNCKITREFKLGENSGRLKVFGGIQNLTNVFQSDFDLGANRDAGYIYGPTRPRTYFIGVKWAMGS